MTTNEIDYRDRLKLFRKARGLTIAELASDLDVDPSHYAKAEKKTRNLYPDQLLALKSKYNVSFEWLIAGNGDMFIAPGSGKDTDDTNEITHQGLPEIITTSNYDRLKTQLLSMNENNPTYGKKNTDDYVTRAEYSILQTFVMKMAEELEQLKNK